jgi:hypothetical protein
MRAEAGFSRHLGFRLFQQYSHIAVIAKLRGEQAESDPKATFPSSHEGVENAGKPP